MADNEGFIVNRANLPPHYPTHLHSPSFWEALGRVVASFGFLEETLGKAIFGLTATQRYPPEKLEAAYAKWLKTLERAMSDPLGGQIDLYAKALRDHTDLSLENVDDLVGDLRNAAKFRNVLCHGSWRPPDGMGKSLPFFVTRDMTIFETALGVEELEQTRTHVVHLALAVIDTVTSMGWQFPGSKGPGAVILRPAS